LRTPLTTIQGYLDLMEDGAVGEMGSEARQYIKNMQQAVHRISVMVNNIIDLSKIEVGRFQVEILPFTVLDQLDFIEGQFEPLIIKKHQTIDFDVDLVLPEVKGDPECFKQVMTNLVSNAVKYTQDGGRITISVHCRPDDKEAIYFTVSDNGLGIPEADLKEGRLFSKFYQVRKGDARIGSGLGLAIVKELVQLMHGDIQVSSELGTGTTFTIRMPIWQEVDY
jgi:two-component system phosphate regulon sensor histidine kinase PhoR